MMQVALGRDSSSEIRTELHKLSARIRGFCGLLITNLPRELIISKMKRVAAVSDTNSDDDAVDDDDDDIDNKNHNKEHKTFAKAGHLATRTIVLDAGPLFDIHGIRLSHTLEPFLLKNGLPTRLNNGIVELRSETTICEKNKPLSVKQAQVLKTLGIKMACFKLWLDSCWANDTFQVICDDPDVSDDDDDIDDDED